ncbi:unnamed protein product [Calypogeia fissa]
MATTSSLSPESGQTSEVKEEVGVGVVNCKVEEGFDEDIKVGVGAGVAGQGSGLLPSVERVALAAGEERKSRPSQRDLRGDHTKLQVKVDPSADSGESEQRNNHSEGKDSSSKHEGSSIFEGKVAVTRSSSRRRLGVQPITPRLEEPRAVRPNRGVKRRYPGEESDDNDSGKRTRVRSITRVCGPNGQPRTSPEVPIKGKVSNGKDWAQAQKVRGQRRGRQSEIFLCNYEGCEKSFTESSALYNHGRVHGDRPYLCHYDGCSKRFSERSKLKRHFLIHTGEKPFICVYEGCGKAFSLDFNLRSHMKTHTGEYHECPHAGCEKRYCQEYKLRAHICKEHKATGKATENGAVLSKEDSVISSNDKANKKKQKADQLKIQRGKLEKCIDGKKKRIMELESELEGETKELSKFEKALRKVSREQEQAELEGCVEQELSSDKSGEGELGEVYGDEKEVVMFAHKLPTADQGARLMDPVVLIGSTRPLSPSISSSQQPFLMSRMQLGPSPNSFNGPIHFLPYSMSANMCHSMDCFLTKQGSGEQLNGSTLSSSQELSMPEIKPSIAQGGGLSENYSPSCQNSQSISFLHEQNSQCEPPVSQLFTYQEQPCLHD